MTEPNQTLLADPRIPRIKFAGKEWPIPKLAIDQLAEVWPLISGSLAYVVAGGAGNLNLSSLSGQVIKDMASAVFWGLRRGHEALSREEFNEMPSDLEELVFAMMVVAAQTGGFKPRKPGEAATPEGEAKRAPLNGTPSRPQSARARAGHGGTFAAR
jgi:hypothetical protein